MTFAQNVNATFIKQPQNGKLQLTNSNTAGAFATLYTGGSNGSKITSILAMTTDTVAHDLQIAITNGGVSYVLGTIAVPAGSGNTSGTLPVNLLDPTKLLGLALDSDGNPYILLQSGDTLTINPVVVVSSTKVVNIVAATAGDF
jgi:hypothetical protein